MIPALKLISEFYLAAKREATRKVESGVVTMTCGEKEVTVHPDQSWQFTNSSTGYSATMPAHDPERVEALCKVLDSNFLSEKHWFEIETVHRVQCTRCNLVAVVKKAELAEMGYILRSRGWRRDPEGALCPNCSKAGTYPVIATNEMEYVA